MADWIVYINNLSAVCSILGLIITVFLFVEARKIQKSFLRRARLPAVSKELAKMASKVPGELNNWNNDKKPALESFSKVNAILENIKPKLPTNEKGKVELYLSRLQPKTFFFAKGKMVDLSEESAWSLYTELSGLITSLEQLSKDSKWD